MIYIYAYIACRVYTLPFRRDLSRVQRPEMGSSALLGPERLRVCVWRSSHTCRGGFRPMSSFSASEMASLGPISTIFASILDPFSIHLSLK